MYPAFSAAVTEKLQEASRIYEISAESIITEIIEENLPKWIRHRYMKRTASLAAERARQACAGSPGDVLVKQDEIDTIFRLMSSAPSS